MKKLLFILLFIIPILASAQLVIPRVPSLASVTSPLPGMQVYSIVDQKMYFRTLTAWVDMSVVSYTASNGLRLTGSVFELGNTALLSKSTTIRTGLSNKFSIVSKDGNDSTWFQTDTDASGLGIRSNSKGQMIYVTPQQMFFQNDSAGMILTGTSWTINDNRFQKKGLEYSDDYTSGFTSLSLIHKGYADNALNSKVNIGDTSSMLTNYRHWAESYLKAADITGKLNISDTAGMLTNYRHWTQSYLKAGDIAGKLNISDTASMLTNYEHWNKGYLKNTNNLSDVSSVVTARSNLGLVIGTDVQAYDANTTILGNATTGSGSIVRATSPTLVTPALGTPASGVATNLTGTAAGLTAGNVTTNANLTGNVTSVGNATTIATIPTTVIGIPLYSRVTGSNATTTGQSLVDITGLSNALVANATYEFTAVLSVSTTAVTTGTGYGVNFSAAGATVECHINGSLTNATNRSIRVTALNTSSSGWLTTSAQTGGILIKGIVITTTNAGNFTISHLKVTSGTSTVFTQSYLITTRIL